MPGSHAPRHARDARDPSAATIRMWIASPDNVVGDNLTAASSATRASRAPRAQPALPPSQATGRPDTEPVAPKLAPADPPSSRGRPAIASQGRDDLAPQAGGRHGGSSTEWSGSAGPGGEGPGPAGLANGGSGGEGPGSAGSGSDAARTAQPRGTTGADSAIVQPTAPSRTNNRAVLGRAGPDRAVSVPSPGRYGDGILGRSSGIHRA